MNANEKILNVRIDNLSRSEINSWLRKALGENPRQKFVVTLNPEIVLTGHRDKKYASILSSADLNLCDGFGIKFVSWLKGRKIEARYTGVDLTDFLLESAKEKNLSILVVVSENSLSSPEEIEKGIAKKYNFQVRAKYWNGENFFDDEAQSAEIVLVNFGAPRQEKFIFENRKKFPQAKILAGVGGTFDFLTGRMKRAPRWMRRIGLEWLWRLLIEPKRLGRIWNAAVIFPVLAIIRAK
jgi:N-acetylglucosaminyldiphosphoundecaprenol N-acetyl-beta-D-mannosaminyltransferase